MQKAAGNDQQGRVIDLVGRAGAFRLHLHHAGAAGQHDHRPVVGVKGLGEARAALVGDGHGPGEIEELVKKMPFGGALEALPLRVGESHVTSLAK